MTEGLQSHKFPQMTGSTPKLGRKVPTLPAEHQGLVELLDLSHESSGGPTIQRPVESCLGSSLVSSIPAYSNLDAHSESAKGGKPDWQSQSSRSRPRKESPTLLHYRLGSLEPGRQRAWRKKGVSLMERAEDSSHFLCSPPESEAESHNLGLLISLYNFKTSSCLVLEFTGSLPWGGHPGCRKAEGLLFKFPHTQSHISPSSIHTPTTTSSCPVGMPPLSSQPPGQAHHLPTLTPSLPQLCLSFQFLLASEQSNINRKWLKKWREYVSWRTIQGNFTGTSSPVSLLFHSDI